MERLRRQPFPENDRKTISARDFRKMEKETGVAAVIGRGEPWTRFGADMDALPIREENSLDFCALQRMGTYVRPRQSCSYASGSCPNTEKHGGPVWKEPLSLCSSLERKPAPERALWWRTVSLTTPGWTLPSDFMSSPQTLQGRSATPPALIPRLSIHLS